MTAITEAPMIPFGKGRLWRGRVAWFVALWIAGVVAVSAAAWLIRWLMGA